MQDVVRLIYWLVVIVLGVWAVFVSRDPPRAREKLGTNHQIRPGDLETREIAALNNLFLHRAVVPGQRVTRDIVGSDPVVTAMPSGFAVVVNVPRQNVDGLKLREGDAVQLKAGSTVLGKPGPIRALSCDEANCAVVVGVDASPGFDPKLLGGARLERAPLPPAPVVP